MPGFANLRRPETRFEEDAHAAKSTPKSFFDHMDREGVRRQRVVEHSLRCTLLAGTGPCNCFLSENASLQVEASDFEPATVEGPAKLYSEGLIDVVIKNSSYEYDRMINDFVSHKQTLRQLSSINDSEVRANYAHLEPFEVRILELHKGEFDDSLQGHFHLAYIDFNYSSISDVTRFTNHAVSLVTKAPLWYTALSYVWGAPDFSVRFHLPYGDILITPGLSSALQHLRSANHSVFLWIDQICINQVSTSEKEQQIPLMGQIYNHATNTLIWLGDPGRDEDPQVAFDIMQRVYVASQNSEQKISPEDFDRLVLPSAEDTAWKQLGKFFKLSWFTRLWVIQEALLSRNAHVRIGKLTVSWENLSNWTYALTYCGLSDWLERVDDDQSRPGWSTLNDLEGRRQIGVSISTSRKSILDFLVTTRYAQATEPKDKIYGVLGIANPKKPIIPRYSKDISARDVYHDACLTVLPQDLFPLLSCVDHDPPLRPTWVPDWSVPRQTEALGYSTKSWAIYAATGGIFDPTGKAYPIKYDLSDDNKMITIPGKLFDTIAIVSDVATQPSLDIDDTISRNRELSTYVDLVKTQTNYLAECSVFEALFHTVTAGRFTTETISAPLHEFLEVFSLLLDWSHPQSHEYTAKKSTSQSKSSVNPTKPTISGQEATYTPRRLKGFFTLSNLRTRRPAKILEEIRLGYQGAMLMRRLAVTESGRFAIVPRGSKIGDRLVLFERCNVPHVVRPVLEDGENAYELLGECYVHGVMKGEVWAKSEIELHPVALV